MTYFTATYSPDDNKLRLYATSRLDSETYAKVKAAGFRWAPKQDLFVAPAWTPFREDLLTELAGEIEDEDKSLTDRAEERAERFDEYRDKRLADAERASDGVSRIADHIPLGQPILIGHHSEKHARKDAERIENGMRKAVKMWKTSNYWKSRALGAIQHAKYKELPAVRHRRIKTIEADKRKTERSIAMLESRLAAWTGLHNLPEEAQLAAAMRFADAEWSSVRLSDGTIADSTHSALRDGKVTPAEVREQRLRSLPATIAHHQRWIEHHDNRLVYERAMLAEQIGADASTNPMADRFDLKVGGRVLCDNAWVVILKVNKAGGVITSVTTTPPRAVTWQRHWKYGVEKIADYQAPSDEDAAKVKAATALPPICNYPGADYIPMLKADWDKKHRDYKCLRVIAATETTGAHRVRRVMTGGYKTGYVFLTDVKVVEPPKPTARPSLPAAERVMPSEYAAPRPREDQPQDAEFKALQDTLKTGVKVVVAPQLFPTPAAVAERMVKLLELEPGARRTLEPSAGTGVLAEAARTAGAMTTLVEVNYDLAHRLRNSFDDVHTADFLKCTSAELGMFDRIIMNPPFAGRADVDHINHAQGFLKPGGRLVALCADGPRQRAVFEQVATAYIPLEPGAFKEQGTNVNVAIVVIDA